MEIELEEHGQHGRYVIRNEGHADSELTFVRTGEATVVADHTYVPDTLRGKGIAKLLVDRLIADAREKGFKVIPACSYVRVVFDRDASLADIRA